MLLLLLLADPPTMSTPQGAASGGRTKVDFIGATRQPVPPVKTPPSPQPKHTPAPAKARPATSPVQSTLVAQADDPVPPPAPVAAASAPAAPAPTPAEQPAPPQPDPAAQQQTQAAASEPEPTQRRETWTGRPPGAIDQDLGPNEAGLVRDGGGRGGRRGDPSDAGPSMELGGYLVYYDLRSETLLRAWMDQGMKEFFILLPGTQYRMACPLEIAMKRGSGKCRALPPDSPELKAIGDAREVITMLQVYKQGELVWRGPGPYK
ncbi:hypothetical protein XTPLMG728_2977 [Xanthomonas translucens pv. poae]|uniref:Plasmid stabilization protein ParE n=1 Tax=Xanthomonas graminis pv. poae TaxID=227946 RepID=A0A0K3A173_9XANT|nr:type II toxin-antitoxin system RelE/ParE family toxin [Xanthomonas translucens]CTP91673.1 hypothetical protein XTPLMG728_2977 [Xanthomonas translucens pv. poae]